MYGYISEITLLQIDKSLEMVVKSRDDYLCHHMHKTHNEEILAKLRVTLKNLCLGVKLPCLMNMHGIATSRYKYV